MKYYKSHWQVDIGIFFFYVDLEQIWVKPQFGASGNLYPIGTRQKRKNSHCIGPLTILSWIWPGQEVILFI